MTPSKEPSHVRGPGFVRRRGRPIAAAVTGVVLAASLAACGSGGKPELNWYATPDGIDTFRAYAEKCSTDDYDILVRELPTSATDQRTQMARRLAANDSSTDLLSLDPVFIAEFANAGWLKEVDGDLADQVRSSVEGEGDYLAGAAETAIWEDGVYAVPMWANTQLLWYRKSLAEKAGLDMSKPVTWDQVIEAADANDGTVGVQALKYEGYVVWINALMTGAGGDIVSDTEAGKDASVDVDSEAGRAAAAVIEKLADSDADQPDLTVSNEGTSLGQMYPAEGAGEFMVNWTFVYKNYEGAIGQPGGPADQQEFEDLGWARYPQTVAGEPSQPPVGGISIGVGAYTEHEDWAVEAAACLTSTDSQVDLALDEGLMPATNSAYDEVADSGDYPEDLVELFRTSVDEAGPRPKSAFWATISSAIQSRWHSPYSVDPDSTPQESAEFLQAVLDGEALL